MTAARSTSRLALTALTLAALSAAAVAADQPVIGLITKTDTNPFFVKMKEGAQAAATAKGAKLLSAAGKADGDNAGQVTAIENMIAGGAKTILITPNDSKAIVPAIKKMDLLSDRQRKRFADLGILQFEDWADPIDSATPTGAVSARL